MRVMWPDGQVLLDTSYTNGTAACTLNEKMLWKLSPKDERGPPPFKGKEPLDMTWADKLSKMDKALNEHVGSPLPRLELLEDEEKRWSKVLRKNKEESLAPIFASLLNDNNHVAIVAKEKIEIFDEQEVEQATRWAQAKLLSQSNSS